MTKSERTEAVFPMFVRRTSDEQLLWKTLRRQWLRKTSSPIVTPFLQQPRPEAKF